MFESHQLFKHSFDLEKRKYVLALQNSLRDCLDRLPLHIQNMKSEDFLAKMDNPGDKTFESMYNLELRLVDSNSSMGLLGHIQNLIKPQIAVPQIMP